MMLSIIYLYQSLDYSTKLKVFYGIVVLMLDFWVAKTFAIPRNKRI